MGVLVEAPVAVLGVVEVYALAATCCRAVKLTTRTPGARGGFQQSYGPPDSVFGKEPYVSQSLVQLVDCSAEMGSFLHACEGEIVCESINTKIPYFNAPIYLENKVRNGAYSLLLSAFSNIL